MVLYILHRFGMRAWPVAAALILLSVPRTAFSQQTDGDFLTQAEQGSQPAESQDQPPVTPPAIPAPEPTPAVQPPPPSPFAPPARRFIRLARAPNMFGDLFGGGTLTLSSQRFEPIDNQPAPMAVTSFPLAGGSRRIKIAENDKALPRDRIFFFYNHFHNALSAEALDLRFGDVTSGRASSIDRYTFGFEKTFQDGWSSVAVRMPFTGDSFDFNTPDLAAAGGETGNLAVVVKRLLYASDTLAVAAGLGIDTPTGSDAVGRLSDVNFRIKNEAVHLLPFVGFLHAPHESFFYQMFVQGDFPTKGNPIDFVAPDGPGHLGSLNEQSLLFLDFSAGYWLYRADSPTSTNWLTGLASVLELHYTSTLQDPDTVSGTLGSQGLVFNFGNAAGRVDVLNLTVGLHAQLASQTTLRVGGAFPLRDKDDKLFDAEFQLSINQYF